MRRRYLLALAGLIALSGLAVLSAAHTDPSDIGGDVDVDDLPVLAEDVPGPAQAEGWIGSKPLTAEDLEGKVVVYDFWTYSCVNCVRTLPHLRSWYHRYRDDGLVVIGVHSPEFEFEKDPDNVKRAVDKLHVDWPVALDPDMRIWNAFGNRYWPAKYIVDRNGALRVVHFGEGAYDDIEDALRKLLGVDPDSPRAETKAEATDPPPSESQSPETYLGGSRGTTASPQGLADPDGDGTPGGTATFSVPKDLAVDSFALDGRWDVADEAITAGEPGAAIVLRYRGGEVNLVLAAGRDADADASANTANAVNISIDGGTPRRIEVGGPDLVNLLEDGPTGEHTMRIEAERDGLAAYAFTFG